MPNGGSDCCGTCPFNRTNKDKSQEPFCEIRKFRIEKPYWTYCNNHPRRNPLLSKTPRGPVWAPIFADYDSKPFSEDLRIPPRLLPPIGDAMYVRVPYYQNTRPIEDESGDCTICGEKCENTISVEPLNEDKKYFCSTAHYFEWWLANSTEATPYLEKAPLNTDLIKNKFRDLSQNLSGAGELLRATGDRDQIIGYLAEIEELFVELGYGDVDVLHAAIYLEAPEISGGRSPHLLLLQVYLTRAGGLLQQEPFDIENILKCLSDIQNTIQRFLKENV